MNIEKIELINASFTKEEIETLDSAIKIISSLIKFIDEKDLCYAVLADEFHYTTDELDDIITELERCKDLTGIR